MHFRNARIRWEKGLIPNWMIAERLGVSENTIVRWMRQEMSPERQERIAAAIMAIKKEIEDKSP